MVDYGAEVLDGTYTVLDALPPVGRFDAVAMGF